MHLPDVALPFCTHGYCAAPSKNKHEELLMHRAWSWTPVHGRLHMSISYTIFYKHTAYLVYMKCVNDMTGVASGKVRYYCEIRDTSAVTCASADIRLFVVQQL